METGLDGKVVFLTGASGGIGHEVAEAFAAEGARLALQGHRRFDELVGWVADRPWRDRALCLRADVTRPAELEQAFERAADEWEERRRVDVCIANAGIWPPENEPLQRLSEERVRSVIEVNLLGALWTARAFLKTLERTGPSPDGHGASLVFTGSTAGRFGERGHVDYSASKAALRGVVLTLKNEIARLDPYGRVNLVEPGWTVTAMTHNALEDDELIRHVTSTMALRQLARAKDVARAVVFLASPELARHVTGEILTVAGGMEGRSLWSREEIDVGEVRSRLEDG
ncbi:MAG: SDR family NAD(P)-dependent oxidoreductase [Planctomycetota bacterium]|nr:SDR family NAD(P)-dependent oxidoreductase [Planctomycetota bacterium]